MTYGSAASRPARRRRVPRTERALQAALVDVLAAKLDLADTLARALAAVADERGSIASLVSRQPRSRESMSVAMLAAEHAGTSDSDLSRLYVALYVDSKRAARSRSTLRS
jgi:hypothetical protein